MPRVPLLATVLALALAAPAAAATTIVPDRLDDPPLANCAPAHPAGTCSLRSAVALAADGDTIQLAAGTYTLSIDQLTVTSDVTFVGAGPDATTIEQHATGKRIIELDSGTTTSMTGLTLTGGNIYGGDGGNGTSGTHDGGNGGGAYGGAINAGGTALTLTLVNLVGNSSTGGNGGTGYSPGSGAGGKGGDGGFADASAIYSPGHVTLDRVTVADNIAHGGTGGNGGHGAGSSAGGDGGKGGSASGAIGGGSAMVLVARDSTFSANKGFAGTGGTGGGGGTSAGHGGTGGRSIRGTGGAIFSNGDVTIVNSTITGNEIHGGTGGHGGGGGILGTGGDGGYAESGEGGGLSLLNAGSPTLSGHVASTTIANNGVFAGTPGAGGSGSTPGATGGVGIPAGGNVTVYSHKLEIRDSVIAGGVGAASSSNCDVSATNVTSHGHNLEDKNQCIAAPAAGDRHDVDPLLGALQDNGGPAKTMAPLSGSPLVNGGPAVCQGIGTPLTADERGMPRDAVCDIGAYEAIAPTSATPPSVGGSPVTGQTVTCLDGTFGGDAPQTVDTAWLRDGQQVATGSQYPIPAADANHSIACRQTATNAYGSATADSAAVQVSAAPTPPAGGGPGTGAARLSNLRIKPKSLHHRTKAKVTFTLSAAARVSFKICRRKGKTCKRVKKGAPKAIRGKQGTNTVRLNGKRFKRGRYRLTATPAGGKGVRASFRVVK